MILLKIAVTILVVTGLSVIAERVSPRAAGILSGYPAGSAISLFFIGMEQGADFGGQTAIYNVAGLTALLVFFFIYYAVSARVNRASILAASLAAAAGFFAAVLLLNALGLPAWAGVLLTICAVLLAQRLFQHIPNARINKRVRLGPGALLFRAGLSALIVVAVTGAANWVGPDLAGLFSAFPTTAYPLVLIVHATYQTEQAHTIIKNYPTGAWSLVLYSLVVYFTYPRLGVYAGTLAAFGAASIYLLLLAGIDQYKSRRITGYN